nr:hypothetical protein [Tanacetum cinerariifolium]
MMLTFADAHNVSEGFNQIIDFLNGSSIKYALTINLNIYVSCIKQFWTSVVVKKFKDVTRLQALVDKKRVIITEATIRYALRLDDAEGIECLPNEEIFAELTRMGYEKPSTKLTFYKAFFSSQWKFLIYTILQCMSAKRRSWNTFSSSMASTVICLSTSRKFNFSKRSLLTYHKVLIPYPDIESSNEVNVEDVSTAGVAAEGATSVTDDDVPAAVDEPSIPSPPPPNQPPPTSQDIPSTSQDAGISMELLQNLLDTCTTLTRRVKHLEHDKIAQALEITKLKQRVKNLERKNKLKASKLRRLKKRRVIANMDADKDVTLKDVATIAKDVHDAEIEESLDDVDLEPAELQEVVKVVTTAKLITEVVTAASGVVIKDPEETATPSTIIHSEAKSKDKGKWILVEEPKPLKKQAQIEQDEAYAREYQALKRKPQTKAQARKNMMIYLRNVAGFKMDYFKGMTYDDIRPIFEKYFNSNVAFLQKTKEQMEEKDSRALKRLSETQVEKAAKNKKLDEEVAELKRHLQIVPNDEDDVYTETTPLARKVPVVDYEIYTENNKP